MTPTPDDGARTRRNRLALLGLLAAFLVPILGAYVLNVAFPGWRPFGVVNKGALVEPPVRVSVAGVTVLAGPGGISTPPFADRWSLAVSAHDGCPAACAAALIRTRQTRLALGKNAHRVTRVLLVTEPPPAARLASLREAHPDLVVLAVPGDWRLPGPAATRSEPGWIVLVDPQGYLVLVYPPDSARDGPLEDLERLLKISKIG